MNAPDPRFFVTLGPTTVASLAELSGAAVDARFGDRPIEAAAVLSHAGMRAISYLDDRRYADLASATGAGACFVSSRDAAALPPTCAALITPAPKAAWALAANQLHRVRSHVPGALGVHPEAELEEGVSLCPGAVVGAGAQIGRPW